MDKRTGRFAVAAVLAGVAGYVTGILTAPKSGKETRKDIKDTASHSVAEAEKKLKKVQSELTDLISKANKQADNVKGKAKDEASTIVEKAKVAKEKARVALSSVRDEDTSDEDLKTAIAEADQAVKHLKKFLKK